MQRLSLFQRFIELCAANTGQLLNASRIGNDCGVTHATVQNWLSVLESSYICFRLAPHFKNYRKRLVKTPKLYFYDVGVVIRLLGIESPDQLKTHPLRGSIFENWVIVELMKSRLNRGKRENLYFWRNNTGLEVDVVVDQAGKLIPVEIKSGATVASDWFSGLNKWMKLAQDDVLNPHLVYGGDVAWQENGVHVLPWASIDSLAGEI